MDYFNKTVNCKVDETNNNIQLEEVYFLPLVQVHTLLTLGYLEIWGPNFPKRGRVQGPEPEF